MISRDSGIGINVKEIKLFIEFQAGYKLMIGGPQTINNFVNGLIYDLRSFETSLNFILRDFLVDRFVVEGDFIKLSEDDLSYFTMFRNSRKVIKSTGNSRIFIRKGFVKCLATSFLYDENTLIFPIFFKISFTYYVRIVFIRLSV